MLHFGKRLVYKYYSRLKQRVSDKRTSLLFSSMKEERALGKGGGKSTVTNKLDYH